MRAIKYKLSRKALNNIYISYTRSFLRSWTAEQYMKKKKKKKKRLKRTQNEAARIVTGLTRSVSIDNL